MRKTAEEDMRLRSVRHCCLALFTGLCMLLAVSTAAAREVSVQEAVAQAQREASGKVLSVQTLVLGKRKFYRIKVLTHDGQVRVVRIAADQ